MKTILIAGIIIAVIAIVGLIIGVVLIVVIRQRNKQIDRLCGEIENIKSYLVIE